MQGQTDMPRRSNPLPPGIATLIVVLAAALLPVVGPLTLLCFWPGFRILAWLGIKPQSRMLTAIASVALSMATAPVILDMLWRTFDTSLGILLPFGLLIIVGDLAHARLGVRRIDDPITPPTRSLKVLLTCLLTVVAAIVMLTSAPPFFDLYQTCEYPSVIHDYIKHHGVLMELVRHGLPLGNPFFAPEANGPVFYYHYFYLAPATIVLHGGGLAYGAAFGLQAALVSAALVAMAFLLGRQLGGNAAGLLAAALCSVVGGYDVFALMALNMRAITLDAWADTQIRIHNLLTQMSWTPQNVHGILILATASWTLSRRGFAPCWLWLGPLMGASLTGTTVWVGLAAFPAVAWFVLWEIRQRRSAALFAPACIVAASIAALALPQLAGYVATSRAHGQSVTLNWERHADNAVIGPALLPPGVFANLLDLPWILAIELGPLLLLPLLARRQVRVALADPGARLLAFAAIVGVAAFVTIRSDFTYNDCGQKVILATQLAGAVFGGLCLAGRAPGAGRIALLCLVLVPGLPVSTTQTPLALLRRFAPPATQAAAPEPLPRLWTAIRDPITDMAQADAELLRFVREQLPDDAVLQTHWGQERLPIVQLVDRPLAVTGRERDTMVFRASATEDRTVTPESACAALESVLLRPATSAERWKILRKFGATHVLVGAVERDRWVDPGGFDAPWFVRLFEDANGGRVYSLMGD